MGYFNDCEMVENTSNKLAGQTNPLSNEMEEQTERRILCHMAERNYGINLTALQTVTGGLSARAFRGKDTKGLSYFIKVYDHSRSGTSRWIAAIAHYIPVLRAMGEDPGLKDRIPVPVLTLAGEPACADADRTCLIYQWIEGESYCARQFSAKELRELMRIVAAVHQFSVPKPLCEGLSREAFDIPFAARLEELLQNAPKDLILPDQRQECMALLEHLQKLRGRLQSAALPVVVCHGDIHRGNVMRDSLGLVLIDWEGLYLAPPEADLFFFQRCQGEMNAFYQKLCRYKPNPVALEFFAVRRRLEDIFEFLVSLLIDKVAPREEAYLRRLLQSELKRLHLPMEFDFL